jgi:hypothetical protein
MWYNEVKDYNYQTGGFAMNTGHFTQYKVTFFILMKKYALNLKTFKQIDSFGSQLLK